MTTILAKILVLVSWLVPTSGASITETSAFCFSGKATVSVYGKGQVRIKDLQVGDYVVTGGLRRNCLAEGRHINLMKISKFLISCSK